MVESSEVQQNQNGISIWISKPYLLVGDLLEGSVCLNMEPNTIEADGLTLFFKGVDELSIWKRHTKGNKRYMKREVKVN